MPVQLAHYIGLASVIFMIGVFGVAARRNAIVVMMSVELMLNAANIALVGFGRYLGTFDGQVMVVIVMVVAAAEAAVGLAIVLAVFRVNDHLDLDRLNIMKG